jgi:GNAT superfamily N-acetyltransferase
MLMVRPLTVQDDLSAAAQVCVDSWQHAYRGIVPQRYLDKLSPQSWISVWKADPAGCLIALLDGKIVGTGYITFARDEARPDYGEIVSLYLLPEAMGRGIGRMLWQAAAEHCREQGLTGLCLWTLAANSHACRFYEHMGMTASGRTRDEAIGGELLPLTEYIFPLA